MTRAKQQRRLNWKLVGSIVLGAIGLIASIIAIADKAAQMPCAMSGTYCQFVVSGPSVNDEINQNMLRATEYLDAAGKPADLEIEAKDFLLGDDRVLIRAPIGEGKSLVDIIATRDLSKTTVHRLTADHLYLVSYPNRYESGRAELRLNLYDTKVGLKASTVSIMCEGDGLYGSPWFDVTNLRFDRANSDLSFDFDSNCDKITPTMGDELWTGSIPVRTRLHIKFDDQLIAREFMADRAKRSQEEWTAKFDQKNEIQKDCSDARLIASDLSIKGKPRWVGDCVSYEPAEGDSSVARREGVIIYYDGKLLDKKNPSLYAKKIYVRCDAMPAYGYEYIPATDLVALYCPDASLDYSNGAWRFKEQTVDVGIYDKNSNIHHFEIGCECRRLVLKALRRESDKSYSFELGADSSNIRINGTPATLGALPPEHKLGSPFNFGRYVVVLSDGGLVSSFQKQS